MESNRVTFEIGGEVSDKVKTLETEEKSPYEYNCDTLKQDLERNQSCSRLLGIPSCKKINGNSKGNTSPNSALPRTLSTSVLRIKNRRSFWEKFMSTHNI
uniref:Uncharacterized protein n=1 Tax=Lepeophtheirus salmonis TaxID=72036 RepID=A0A0K2T3G9_LEPSM